MGFQHMPEVVHKAASRKGGKIKVDKGLATMSYEKRRAIQSEGGKARYANRGENKIVEKRDSSMEEVRRVERISGALDG